MKKYFLYLLLLLQISVNGVWAYNGYSDDNDKLLTLAKQGDVKSQYMLGMNYYTGFDDVPQNYTQAVYWFRKAANQGNRRAQLFLGTCYDNGWGISQDYAQAVYWYQKAAEQGDEEAQYFLGDSYEIGRGVNQDYVQAVYWYWKAAEKGYALAYYRLGKCYHYGNGVAQDFFQATDWYRKAAKKGNKNAQYELGYCYEKGLGVVQDNSCAADWYLKAAEQGHTLAKNNLEKLNANIGPNPLEQNSLAQNPLQAKNPTTTFIADVDKNLPTTSTNQARTFALIIANEHYELAEPVEFALNDGKVFANYCEQTLGLPKQNIRLYEDATYGQMRAAIRDIKDIADAFDSNMQLIVYYAGHGIPNEQTKEAYLLPVDVDGRHTEEDCYPLSRLYRELGELDAKNVTVFLDACFSGAQRGEGMLASARGVVIKPKKDNIQGNVVVFSAATEDETAFPYKEKGHGMFTYFLLKKLRDTKGDCTLGELDEYIKTNVRQQSVVINRKSQTPTVLPSQALINSWQTLKLK